MRRAVLTAALLVVAARQASTQTVAGRVIDRSTRLPLRSIAVRVLGDSGQVLAESKTDTAGIFYANLVAPAHVTVRFFLDSVSTFDSEPLAVGTEEFAQREFVVSIPPQVYFEFQVDKQVQPTREGMVAPRYPKDLKAENVEGEVLMQFVVDTMGRAELNSMRVLKSSHPLFAEAVRESVRASQYLPAEVNGHKVRQLVQQPFSFTLERAPMIILPSPRPRPSTLRTPRP